MQADRVDEHTHIASHVTPGHALLNGVPQFLFSQDALNYAALDQLVGFTTNVCDTRNTHTSGVQCSCFIVVAYETMIIM